MTFPSRMINGTIRGVTRTICRVDADELYKVPHRGPLILAVNHVNFLDAPLLYTHLLPRPITALVKKETWNNFFLGALFSMWKAIPIRRGEVDLTAFRLAKEALAERQILVVAPEGTRSKTGHLQRGKPGFSLLASEAKSPIQPMAFYGGEVIWDNMQRLVRTDFHVRVGEIYQLKPGLDIRDKEVRQGVTDETMWLIAALLPEEYRGFYSEPKITSLQYLEITR